MFKKFIFNIGFLGLKMCDLLIEKAPREATKTQRETVNKIQVYTSVKQNLFKCAKIDNKHYKPII